MGEARRRGTFEQRKAAAIKKYEQCPPELRGKPKPLSAHAVLVGALKAQFAQQGGVREL